MKKAFQYILQNSLPGEPAQIKMSPSERNTSDRTWDKSSARNSSVLIMLYRKEDKWYFPLIKRASYNGAHSGQISLPGGKWETIDANAWSAALRETREETGVVDSIECVGELTSLYIPFSNFMVYPFIGMINYEPHFVPDNFEVDQLIEASLDDLLSQSKSGQKHFTFQYRNKDITAPYYEIQGHCVWGATAMILSEFCEVATLSKIKLTDSLHSCNAHNVPESLSHTDKALRHDSNQI